jgi:NAD(P)-dependent dehydrogenase (short-subunit alcohol dehydrogenase family)
VNKLDRFDAVIHNAGVGYREGRVEMEPGVPSVFAVNVLAPYILTALIERPKRLVYVSSGMCCQVNLSRSEKLDAGRTITLPLPHSAIRPPLRLERSAALIARRDGVEG